MNESIRANASRFQLVPFVPDNAMKQSRASVSQNLKNLLLQFQLVVVEMRMTRRCAKSDSFFELENSKKSSRVADQNDNSIDVRVVEAVVDEESIFEVFHLREHQPSQSRITPFQFHRDRDASFGKRLFEFCIATPKNESK